MFKKRAQGLSINVIILVVIGLIVLVVLLSIFNKQSGNTVKFLESCGARGGTCESSGVCSDNNGRVLPEINCPESNEVCCVGSDS